MITRTGSYAIRAVMYLVEVCRRHSQAGNVTAREIAEATGIPHNYLTKVLCEMAHAGILHSTRGPGGGFRPVQGADRLTLKDVLTPFETPPHAGCFLCPEGCPEGPACSNQERCLTLMGQVEQFLRTTRVIDLVSDGREAEHPKSGP